LNKVRRGIGWFPSRLPVVWEIRESGVTELQGKDGTTVKKLLALVLVAGFAASTLVGCGGGETKTTTKATPGSTESTKKAS
jgi:hypothetical protein